jgi:ribonucleoside-diphosphate reductase alpha chain
MIEPKFDENALAVLKERYLWKNDKGEPIETPQEMLERVAGVVASREESAVGRLAWAKEFYNIMASKDFFPNSPTLMNAGRSGGHGQLSACFVLGIEDSMDSIFTTLKHQALIHKSGGGTGFNFSNLRAEGDIVNSTNGKASGPVSFMSMFDLATDVVQQGGMRRGANMGILNCDHPDILKFIKAKTKDGKLKNFNISVAADDAFMKAAVEGKNSVFDEIVKAAWETGDPGMIFLDTINEKNTTPWLGELNATNPCGEVPLYPFEACNLGSINLSNMVEKGEISYTKISRVVRTAVRFLDNVIDINEFPLPQIKEAVLKTRKIGLGVMGFAELLFKLKIPYDSAQAVLLGSHIMEHIRNVAHHESYLLGIERGTFDPRSVRRNATLTCIAPTGTISLLAGCSSGIEPVFALQHKRIAFAGEGEGVELEYYNPVYLEAVEDPYWSDTELNRVFVTAHDIDPVWHVTMQAAFQEYTDLAVSKTVNLPHDAKIEDVRNIYIKAWMNGCKGVTVYRDGCKNTQVLYKVASNLCPQCGASLKHQDGCVSCTKCSWGKCSM